MKQGGGPPIIGGSVDPLGRLTSQSEPPPHACSHAGKHNIGESTPFSIGWFDLMALDENHVDSWVHTIALYIPQPPQSHS
jgi:hypothetical protein